MHKPGYLGQLFVISAPSGVGKSTLIGKILENCPDLKYSVSCTTRSPRPDEINGKDYVFLTREEFQNGIAHGRFLEWAEVHGNFYGTDMNPIESWRRAGSDVLLDIDVQGARMVRCFYPTAQTIFILPPSLGVLEKRLKNRATETEEQLAIRFAAARNELFQAPWYDFVVINDDFQKAVADVESILRAGRCTRAAKAPVVKAFLMSMLDAR